jgi:hypothetical protein
MGYNIDCLEILSVFLMGHMRQVLDYSAHPLWYTYLADRCFDLFEESEHHFRYL